MLKPGVVDKGGEVVVIVQGRGSNDAVSIIDDWSGCQLNRHSNILWCRPSVPRRMPLPIHMPVFKCRYLESPVSMWM